MRTILIISSHLMTRGSLLWPVWRRHNDTSNDFIPSHIHTSYFRIKLFMYRGHPNRRPLMRLLLSKMESRGTWCWPKGWVVLKTMSMLSWPVVRWSKGLVNDIIWKQYCKRFVEGGFIVLGVLLGVAGLSFSFMVL